MYYDYEFTSLYSNEELKENTNIYVKAIVKKQANDSDVNVLKSSIDNSGDINVWNMRDIIYAFKNGTLDIYTFIPDMETKRYIAVYGKTRYDKQIEWYEYDDLNDDIKNIKGLTLVKLFLVIDGELKSNSMNESETFKSRYYYDVLTHKELNIYDKCCLWSDSINRLEETKDKLGIDYYMLSRGPYDTLHILYKQVSVNNNDYYKVVEKFKDLETGEEFGLLEYLSAEHYEYIKKCLVKSNDSYVEDNVEYYWAYLDIKKLVESFK